MRTATHELAKDKKNGQATISIRKKVFAMMKENNRISDGLVESMINWCHSGFSVHNEVVINENDREALGRLAQ